MMRKPKFGSVYLITNTVNDKVYVGLTRGYVSDRWYHHKLAAKNGAPSVLYRAMRKYGTDCFKIEHIASAVSLERLGDLETQLIIQYGAYGRAGYNCSYGGESHRERRLSKEGLASVRAARRTPEARARNSDRNKAWMMTEAGRAHQAAMVEAARAAGEKMSQSRAAYMATKEGLEQVLKAAQKGAAVNAERSAKPVMVAGDVIKSVAEASRRFGVEPAAVRWRIKSPHFQDWGWA